MEPNNDYIKIKDLKKKAKFWQAHVTKWKKSNLSCQSYAQKINVPSQTFYHWIQKDRIKTQKIQQPEGFIKVGQNGQCSIEIGKIVIKAAINDLPQIIEKLKGLE